MRLNTACLALAILASGTAPLYAHDDFRVIGTVAKLDRTALQVKTREGKTVSIKMDKQTQISRDKKKVDLAELKLGGTVVVEAYGDSYDDLLALEVRLVPAITPPSPGR